MIFLFTENLRSGFGFSTDYAKFSEYDKLEKALLSGMPNEVDFVVNVCTLLSNESKHTLQLGKSRHLTDLLLAHIGVFQEGKCHLFKGHIGKKKKKNTKKTSFPYLKITIFNPKIYSQLCIYTHFEKHYHQLIYFVFLLPATP